MSKKILIVDDEPGIVQVLKTLLEIYGHQVLTASGGNEAITIIRNNPDIAFIISDMRMDKGNGLQLLDALNEEGLKIPFLLVTGFADVTTNEVMSKGALGIMNKPFDIDKLIETVEANIK